MCRYDKCEAIDDTVADTSAGSSIASTLLGFVNPIAGAALKAGSEVNRYNQETSNTYTPIDDNYS